MFFRACTRLKNLKSLQAVLQGTANYLKNQSTDLKFSKKCERTSRRTFRMMGGSLTVEAALVFPLFIFAVTAFLYLFLFLQLRGEVGRALTDAGKALSELAYSAEGDGSLSFSALSMLYGDRYVEEYLEGKASVGIVKDKAAGISTLGSVWSSETSEFTLRASYQVTLPPGLSLFHPIRVTQVKTVRGWVGFGERGDAESEGEEIVYLTEHGSVYHRSLECRHLKHSVRQADLEETEGLRNASGGKYYPCERCWEKGNCAVYITSDGNRYHARLNCPSLLRAIRAVPLSEAEGLWPCSVCGG